MAYVKFLDGSAQIVKADIGIKLWEVLNGEVEPNDEQRKFCSRIKGLYLNWRNAPDSYHLQNIRYVGPMVLAGWIVDRSGYPTQPEPSDEVSSGKINHAEVRKYWRR